jgi:hypothetical protein
MREALGHHLEASFSARFRKATTGREAPSAQEFLTKAIKDLQKAKAMRGERRLPSPNTALFADQGRGLRVCVNIPGLSRVAS